MGGNQRRDARDGRGLPRHEQLLVAQPCGLEERIPVHARRLAREVRSRPEIVRVPVDGRCLVRRLRPGEGGFEREHRGGALVRAVEPGELQQLRDGGLVLASLFDRRRILAQVIVTAPEAKAALHEECAIVLLAMDAVFHGESEHRRGGVDPEVERIHVRVHGAAEQASERDLVARAVDPGEHGCERGDSLFVDGRLVEQRRAEVGHLAGERAGGRDPSVVEDRRNLPAGEGVDVVAHRPPVATGRQDGGLQPPAVGIREEVVARRDARVDRTDAGRLGTDFSGRQQQHDAERRQMQESDSSHV